MERTKSSFVVHYSLSSKHYLHPFSQREGRTVVKDASLQKFFLSKKSKPPEDVLKNICTLVKRVLRCWYILSRIYLQKNIWNSKLCVNLLSFLGTWGRKIRSHEIRQVKAVIQGIFSNARLQMCINPCFFFVTSRERSPAGFKVNIVLVLLWPLNKSPWETHWWLADLPIIDIKSVLAQNLGISVTQDQIDLYILCPVRFNPREVMLMLTSHQSDSSLLDIFV